MEYKYHSKSIDDIAKRVEIEKNHAKSFKDEILMLEFKQIPAQAINALTRAVMAHVPTMRIDPCFVDLENTNSDLDPYTIEFELGKIPILANPDDFLYENEVLSADQQQPSWKPRFEADQEIAERIGYGIEGRPHYPKISTWYEFPPLPDHRTTLVFHLNVECTFNEETKTLENEYVTGAHLKWIPIGDQAERLTVIPTPNPNAVVCKLGWGQKMNRIVHAVKGTGFEHTKWRGATSYFHETSNVAGEYDFCIKSLDGMSSSKYFKMACDEIESRFRQLVTDCLQKSTS